MKYVFLITIELGMVILSSCSGGGGGGEPAGAMNQANRAPSIISASEAVFPQTRTGTAYTIRGSDPDGDRLTYSISGDDAAAFSLNEGTGELTFVVAPDVDAPGSPINGNFYFIDVTVQDPSGASASQLVIIEVARYDPEGPFLFTDGAVFIGPDTIVPSDPSTLQSVNFSVNEIRTIADNRAGNDVQAEVNVYDAVFENGQRIEMVVNAEIEPLSAAEDDARYFANILGQLDPMVVAGIETVWINAGTARITGPVGGIVVHTGTFQNELIPLGAAEEVMAHEAVHATLDPIYLSSTNWTQAQKADVAFVSQYAREFPETEDLAESYGAYLIVKNDSRNPSNVVERLQNGIPGRIVFFQTLGL